MQHKRKRACIYCRISEDREGQENGVGTQQQDCLALADQLGIDVLRVFIDNDISASTLSSKPRPDFDEMLELVEAGEYDVIISLTNGRLTRRPMELETLIKLHDKTGVLITTVKSGSDDLSTADGRMVARIKGNVDAAEAERTSERVARDVARRRDAGEVHGGPPMFGYVHPTKTNGVKYLQVKDERAADGIVKAAVMLMNGGDIAGVMSYWNSAGLYRPNGTPWLVHSAVQSTLKAPKLAGYTSIKGVAHRPGNWPSIIDLGTHYELVRILSPKQRHGPKVRKHLLPGFIFCECGTGMIANVAEKYGLNRYLCSKQRGGCGKVSRFRPWVEAAVLEFVRGRLEAGYESPSESELPALVKLEGEVRAQEEEIARLRDSVRLGVFTAGEIANDVIAVRAKIAELRRDQGVVAKVAARPSMSVADTVRVLVSNELTLLGERRQIIARHVDKIIVHPLPQGEAWGANKALPANSISILPAKTKPIRA